jgi:hypothetical protein
MEVNSMEQVTVIAYLDKIHQIIMEIFEIVDVYDENRLKTRKKDFELLKKWLKYLSLACSKIPSTTKIEVKKTYDVDLDAYKNIADALLERSDDNIHAIYTQSYQLAEERGKTDFLVDPTLLDIGLKVDSCEIFEDPDLNIPESYQVELQEGKAEEFKEDSPIPDKGDFYYKDEKTGNYVIPWFLEDDPELYQIMPNEFKERVIRQELSYRKQFPNEKIRLGLRRLMITLLLLRSGGE